MTNKIDTTKVLITATILLLLLPTTAVAAVTIDTGSEYSGGEDGETQAIEVEYTISPEDNDMEDVRIQIDNTANSFIDHNSYDREVSPGDADINIQSVGEGVFEIDEVQTNEEVTFIFDAYPRDIQTRSLDVANINVEYVQSGQSLSEETTITADLSNSPWFQLQQAGGGIGIVGALFSLLIGLAVGGGSVWVLKNERSF